MSEVPSHSRLVSSLDEIKSCTDTLIHIAIKRTWGYYHHLLWRNWAEAKTTIFEYSVSIINLIFAQGEVIEEELSEEELEENIRAKNVYIINAPDYPKKPEEILEALKRFFERIKEKLYALAYNNCEHLVNYVLTGKSKSEQIDNLGAVKKFFVDSIDHFITNGKMNLLKLLCSLLTCIPVNCFIQVAVEAIIHEAKKSVLQSSASVISLTHSCAAKNLCKIASKKMGLESSRLLKSEACMRVAEKASTKALVCTGGTTFVMTGIFEFVFTGLEMRTLRRQKKDGHISQYDYDREYSKKISGAFGATFGSVGLGVVGQALCPVPLLGYAVGNAAGNVVGRWLTSAYFGRLYDKKNAK